MPLPHYHGGYRKSMETILLIDKEIITSIYFGEEPLYNDDEIELMFDYEDIQHFRSLRINQLFNEDKKDILAFISTFDRKGQIVSRYDSNYHFLSFNIRNNKLFVKFKNILTVKKF